MISQAESVLTRKTLHHTVEVDVVCVSKWKPLLPEAGDKLVNLVGVELVVEEPLLFRCHFC